MCGGITDPDFAERQKDRLREQDYHSEMGGSPVCIYSQAVHQTGGDVPFPCKPPPLKGEEGAALSAGLGRGSGTPDSSAGTGHVRCVCCREEGRGYFRSRTLEKLFKSENL